MSQQCSRYWDKAALIVKCNSGPYETYISLGGHRQLKYIICQVNMTITEGNEKGEGGNIGGEVLFHTW